MKKVIPALVLLGGLFFQSAFSASVQAADSTVGAELVIPPAETYVIGDSIPLYWRFTNKSATPVGFMWEGCCRINGRLTIARNGQEVPPIPAVQAMAHMFAKAEVLAPERSKDYETFISDWAVLPETGTYELSGRYIGVLDFQKPQVPRGINLWREAALTGTNRLSVLSIADYLKQRTERTSKRGLSVELSGPLKFPLLGSAEWSLRVRNTGAEPRTFVWPDDLSLWVVNAQGFRETRVPSRLEGDYAEITVAPGKEFARHLKLDYSRMEGEPPGRYQVFIDLKTTTNGLPRVPSNTLPLHWEFSADDIAQLVSQAAAGNKVGSRNPALKFLRVYLAEFGAQLKVAAVPSTDTRAQELLGELRLASDVKAFSPQPGRKDWELAVTAAGEWKLADEKLRTVLGSGKTPLESIQGLLHVKRHLGLDMGLTLLPEAKATAATWFTAARALVPVQSELAAPVHLRALPQSTNTTGIVHVRLEAGPANVVILLSRTGQGLQVRAAHKIPNPQAPQTATVFTPGDVKGMQVVSSPGQLLALVSDARLRAPQVQVFCPADVTLAELKTVLEPLWAKVNQVDLVAAP